VGIEGDRVVAIGDLRDTPRAAMIDAAGRIVAPGFIDVHNHSDGWLLKTANFAPKTLQGFTTEVLMSDGISYAPVDGSTARQWVYYLRALDGLEPSEYRGWQTLGEFMRHLTRTGTAQNAALQIPYANVRSLVCGFGERPVDDFQRRQIEYEVRAGMEQGAVGLSTGLDYIVQCFSTTEEVAAACAAMADRGGVYATHVRYKRGLLPALREAVEIGRRANVPVHISHLKAQPNAPAEQVFELLEEAARDVDLTFDVYPYQPGSTMLNYLLPYEVWEAGPLAALDLLHRPHLLARFRQGLKAYRLDLDHIRVAWMPGRHNAKYIGQTLAEYVVQAELPADEALLNLLIEESLAVLCVMDEGDDRLVHPFLAHPRCMIGTDGIYFPDSCVHPRVYGSAGRVLGPYVRDLHLFTLEEAVYKLSGFAAARFQLVDRGELRTGAFADVVVFDPDTVADRATFADPHQPTVGIEHVLVNGVPIVAGGEPQMDFDGSPPGRVLEAGR
jgi:N-acyl-D-amino-acid deacylase